jgi:hypothetical protein
MFPSLKAIISTFFLAQLQSVDAVFRRNLFYTIIFMLPNLKKIEALRSCGALNRNPQKVRHLLFAEPVFFDPRDLVQLKYEAIRAVDVDGCPIVQASADFGLSRPTINQAQENFQQEGFGAGLPLKLKRWPRKKHANSRRRSAST